MSRVWDWIVKHLTLLTTSSIFLFTVLTFITSIPFFGFVSGALLAPLVYSVVPKRRKPEKSPAEQAEAMIKEYMSTKKDKRFQLALDWLESFRQALPSAEQEDFDKLKKYCTSFEMSESTTVPAAFVNALALGEFKSLGAIPTYNELGRRTPVTQELVSSMTQFSAEIEHYSALEVREKTVRLRELEKQKKEAEREASLRKLRPSYYVANGNQYNTDPCLRNIYTMKSTSGDVAVTYKDDIACDCQSCYEEQVNTINNTSRPQRWYTP